MLFLLIVVVIVALLAVIFALQNAVPVTVSFLFIRAESSLALVLLITLAIGVLLGVGVLIHRIYKLQRKISAHEKEIHHLEDRLQKALERKTGQASPPPKSSSPAGPEKGASKDKV